MGQRIGDDRWVQGIGDDRWVRDLVVIDGYTALVVTRVGEMQVIYGYRALVVTDVSENCWQWMG
jgi:pantothenate kinase type III